MPIILRRQIYSLHCPAAKGTSRMNVQRSLCSASKFPQNSFIYSLFIAGYVSNLSDPSRGTSRKIGGSISSYTVYHMSFSGMLPHSSPRY